MENENKRVKYMAEKRIFLYNEKIKRINYIVYGALIYYSDENYLITKDKLLKNKTEIEIMTNIKFNNFMRNVRNIVKLNSELMSAKNENDEVVYILNNQGQVTIEKDILCEILKTTDRNLLKVYLYLKHISDKKEIRIDRKDIAEAIGLSSNSQENLTTITKATQNLESMGLIKKDFKYIVEIKDNGNFQTKRVIYYKIINDKKLENSSLIRNEGNFLRLLEEKLLDINIEGIKQYKILNFYIDYYIPSLNIAIEYDEELAHKSYSYEKQEGRQIMIEKELNCRFIRVSDKDSNEDNINKVMSQLFLE